MWKHTEVAHRLGLAAPIIQGTLPLGLTKKEGKILTLLAAGYTNEQIAAGLFVTTMATVKTHINRLYSEISVRSRQEAIHVALSL